MKKFLPLLFAVIALPLFQSCVGPGYYGSGYGSATNYGSSVGIVSTSHSRWGYDPYHRSYYDYSLGQYYDLNRGRYYSSLPQRYSTPYYPSNYSRGSSLRCPTNLPYLQTSYRRPSVTFASTRNSRWAYDPYRRSYYDQQRKRYYNTSSGGYYNSLPKRHSSPSYPSGYRSGQSVQLHSSLPYVSHRTHSSPQRNRNYGSRNSSSRNQRSSYQSSRNQQPTLGTSSYRNRSSNSNRPSSSRQRSRPTIIPSRTTTRAQVVPQIQQPRSRSSRSSSNDAEQAMRQRAEQQSRARAVEQAARANSATRQRRKSSSRSSRGGSSSAQPSSRGSRGDSRGSARKIY